jgi:septum formation protein
MLRAAGVDCLSIAPTLDESAEKNRALDLNPQIEPHALASLLADAKARSVSVDRQHDLVIGSDQVLAVGSKIFTKPMDRQGAAAQLAALSGQTHALHSAVSLASGGDIVWHTVVTARLTMRPLARDEIDRYLDRAPVEIYQSVGAYHIEGLGSQLFDAVDGDYFTIMGMPLIPLLAALRARGFSRF